jgi:hypothetical protein
VYFYFPVFGCARRPVSRDELIACRGRRYDAGDLCGVCLATDAVRPPGPSRVHLIIWPLCLVMLCWVAVDVNRDDEATLAIHHISHIFQER